MDKYTKWALSQFHIKNQLKSIAGRVTQGKTITKAYGGRNNPIVNVANFFSWVQRKTRVRGVRTEDWILKRDQLIPGLSQLDH